MDVAREEEFWNGAGVTVMGDNVVMKLVLRTDSSIVREVPWA